MVIYHTEVELPITATELHSLLVLPRILSGFFERGCNLNILWAAEEKVYAWHSEKGRYCSATWDESMEEA